MLRKTVFAVAALVLGLTTLAGDAQATTATHCAAMLDEVEDARTSLDEYDASLLELAAERTELTTEIAALDARIVRATGKVMMSLRAERDAAALELTLVDTLQPEIVAQTEALRATIDASERGYIACIETLVGS